MNNQRLTNDPLGELVKVLIRQNDPIPISVAVACTDMQALWNTCRSPRLMLIPLAYADPIAAVQCACACVRRVLHLVPADETAPRRLIDACEAWLRRRNGLDNVLDALEDCFLREKRAKHIFGKTPVFYYVVQSASDVGLAVATIAGAPHVRNQNDDYPRLRSADAAHRSTVALEVHDNMYFANPLDVHPAKLAKRAAATAGIVRAVAPIAPKISAVIKAYHESFAL